MSRLEEFSSFTEPALLTAVLTTSFGQFARPNERALVTRSGSILIVNSELHENLATRCKLEPRANNWISVSNTIRY
jgi:hypothetical protein